MSPGRESSSATCSAAPARPDIQRPPKAHHGMARPEGLEPPTPRFEAWCSIRLSYGRTEGHRTEWARQAASPPDKLGTSD